MGLGCPCCTCVDTGVPVRVRVQGAARWIPVPFPRLVRGSLSRGNAVASGTEAACRVEEAVFLGA